MKERPILFSTEMVKAILGGRKTMTRRVIKPQPPNSHDNWQISFIACSTDKKREGKYHWIVMENDFEAKESGDECFHNPFGVRGDLLYVRESFVPGYFDNGSPAWKADWNETAAELMPEPKWKPSIHMPKKAARIWLKVKDVRVERLNQIDTEDALLEGIDMESDHASLCINIESSNFMNDLPNGSAAIAVFKHLWDSINAARGYSWESNPWVWVLDFDVLSTDGKPDQELLEVSK